MSRTARQGLGDAGEALARRRLEALGYAFIDANWRCPHGELDLVMRDGDILVFVEVRTRHGEWHGTAEESITPAKATRLLRAATAYLDCHPPVADLFWRIDVVAITLSRSGAITRVAHLVDAVHSG